MAIYKLVIEGRLPDLNDYQYKCRSHFSKGAAMKKQCIGTVGLYVIQQLKGVHIDKMVTMKYVWYEPNRKRDLDNISSFGRKCIQDALVECEVLQNDGWKNINSFTDEFYVDKENPRIEVYIKEVE